MPWWARRWRRRATPHGGSSWAVAALLDRLTHRCHLLEFRGESYRFRESLAARPSADIPMHQGSKWRRMGLVPADRVRSVPPGARETPGTRRPRRQIDRAGSRWASRFIRRPERTHHIRNTADGPLRASPALVADDPTGRDMDPISQVDRLTRLSARATTTRRSDRRIPGATTVSVLALDCVRIASSVTSIRSGV